MAADSGRAPARSPDRHGAYLPAPVATGTPPIVERPAAPSGQIIRRPSEYDGELIPAGRCRMRLIACGTFSCPCPRPASWPGFDREPAHKPGLLLSASHGRRGARRFSLRRTLAHSGACCLHCTSQAIVTASAGLHAPVVTGQARRPGPLAEASARLSACTRHRRSAARRARLSELGRAARWCSVIRRSNRGPRTVHTVRPRCQSQFTANPPTSAKTTLTQISRGAAATLQGATTQPLSHCPAVRRIARPHPRMPPGHAVRSPRSPAASRPRVSSGVRSVAMSRRTLSPLAGPLRLRPLRRRAGARRGPARGLRTSPASRVSRDDCLPWLPPPSEAPRSGVRRT
jgi:hypothetical protein